MGAIQAKQQLPDRKNFHLLDYGYCRVWKRKADSLQIMQQYQFTIESQQRLKAFQNVWPLRTNHPKFVNVYYFSHSQASNFCGQLARGSLFTERIPFRLSEFANIKYPQIVSILKNCIEGYSILYQNFGLFYVRSTMIGLTQNYQTKIWFHTDFSQPQPQNPNCKNIQQMFISIISAVQSACQFLSYNCPRFSQFIVQTNYFYFSKDFKHLMKGLEDYIQKLNIMIPSNLHRLKDYIKKPQGWELFKNSRKYPQVIPSETQLKQSIVTEVKFNPKVQSYFLKKQISQVKQDCLEKPTLKKNFSNNNLQIKTTDRVLIQSIRNQHIHISQNRNRINHLPPNNQNIYSHHVTHNPHHKKDQLKFWRSSQKISVNTPKYDHHVLSATSASRFHSPPHKMSFNNPSNEYYGDNSQITLQKRFSQTKASENFGLGRKSIDMTTDTRNRDKSIKSEISLIEDLELQANYTTSYKAQKHY